MQSGRLDRARRARVARPLRG